MCAAIMSRAVSEPIPCSTFWPGPPGNDHGLAIPEFWKNGPHFALFVGLTEGDTFADPTVPLRDACVFLRDEEDRVMLKPPPASYRAWCETFFQQCAQHLSRFRSIRQQFANPFCPFRSPAGAIKRASRPF